MSEHRDLKRLAFVNTCVHKLADGAAYVEGAYKKVKPLVPKPVQPLLGKVEDAVRTYAPPVLTRASDHAEKLLRTADDKVDTLYLETAKFLSQARQLTQSNMDTFRAAADKYYQLVKFSADYMTVKLRHDLSVQNARDQIQKALDKAKTLADPDAAVRVVYNAWHQFAAVPAVAELLKKVAPVTQKGFDTFVIAHDALVGSGIYKRSVNLGASTLDWATTTTPYRLGAQYLYPLVQPVADPALEKVTRSTYINATVKYWSPVAAA